MRRYVKLLLVIGLGLKLTVSTYAAPNPAKKLRLALEMFGGSPSFGLPGSVPALQGHTITLEEFLNSEIAAAGFDVEIGRALPGVPRLQGYVGYAHYFSRVGTNTAGFITSVLIGAGASAEVVDSTVQAIGAAGLVSGEFSHRC